MNSEERLREYVNMDTIYQDFKNGKDVFSDFDMFCVEHCKDIEELLDKNKELEDDLYAANQCVNELLDVQSNNNKAIEYIEENAYCGVIEDENVVASKVLQDEEIDDLLNILKGEDNDKD